MKKTLFTLISLMFTLIIITGCSQKTVKSEIPRESSYVIEKAIEKDLDFNAPIVSQTLSKQVDEALAKSLGFLKGQYFFQKLQKNNKDIEVIFNPANKPSEIKYLKILSRTNPNLYYVIPTRVTYVQDSVFNFKYYFSLARNLNLLEK